MSFDQEVNCLLQRIEVCATPELAILELAILELQCLDRAVDRPVRDSLGQPQRLLAERHRYLVGSLDVTDPHHRRRDA